MSRVVLFSGGLDSAVLLELSRRATDGRTLALTFDYGQPHRIEVKYAKMFCARRGIEHWTMSLDVPASGLLTKEESPVVLGRNMIMLSAAASLAMVRGDDEVWFGATGEDDELFPDCRPLFVHKMNGVMEAIGGPRISAPLMGCLKGDIFDMARDMEIDVNDTWSCYFPEDKKPCGACLACKVRKRGEASVA